VKKHSFDFQNPAESKVTWVKILQASN